MVSMTIFKSYLSNRSQITKLGENSSSEFNINIGVPQRSILGLILCMLYINDIHNCLDIFDYINLTLFTNDTSLSICKNNNIYLTKQLLSDLTNWLIRYVFIHNWKLYNSYSAAHIPTFHQWIASEYNLNYIITYR